jgi:hypothetical protein
MAKIAPWCLARQDRLSAKEPGQVAGVTSPPTLSAHTRNRYAPLKKNIVLSNWTSEK